MTCVLPSVGGCQSSCKRIEIVDHQQRQKTVAPAGEDLEQRMLR